MQIIFISITIPSIGLLRPAGLPDPEEGSMYVCICNAVNDAQIEEAAANGARSLADLERMLGVATGCGCCAQEAEQRLNEARTADPAPMPSHPGFQPA